MLLPRLLVAAATWGGGHHLVHSSNAWRSGVHSFYTTTGSENRELSRTVNVEFGSMEVWVEHPDYVSPDCAGCVSSYNRSAVPLYVCPNTLASAKCGWCGNGKKTCGEQPCFRFHEQRYVVTPSLANQARARAWLTFWPDYDWLLFGDAEVVWFAQNVRDALRGVDPSQPWYFVEPRGGATAACVFPGRDPVLGRRAAAAAPTNGSSDGGEGACVRFPAPSPLCTPSAIIQPQNCAWDVAQDRGGGPNPRPPGAVWQGGNWGLAVSRGLMERVTPAQWLDCVTCAPDFHGCYGGGDCRVGECLWRHGAAPTFFDRPRGDFGDGAGPDAARTKVHLGRHIAFLEEVAAAAAAAPALACGPACLARLAHPLSADLESPAQMAHLEAAHRGAEAALASAAAAVAGA